MKTTIRILLLFLLSLTVSAQSPKYEVRAVWLTTIGGIDWPRSYAVWTQQQELRETLDQLQAAGINTVLFQSRVRATTVFPSSIEPWDACLTGEEGRSPGYDPLQFCIDECHRRGMELHAWIVTLPVGKWNAQGCRQLRQRYPRLVRKIGDEGYMNPEMAETGDYLARFCQDVVRRYDIDGIHLDYIRYPETWPLRISRQQGRDNITTIVRKIHQSVKSLKPWVKLSCSPIGKHDDLRRQRSNGWNAYSAVCQDAQGWLRDGLMDALFPMMYFQGQQFYPFVADWREHSYGRIVAPGLAIYMLHPKERNWGIDIIEQEMGVLRQEGMGCTFFRSKFLTDNTKGIYSFTKDFNRIPALIPPMTWYRKPTPRMQGTLQVKRGTSADQLTWYQANDLSGGDYLLYNIYASTAYPVDTNDPGNLIAIRMRGTSLHIPHQGQTLNYAVTATDRYGQESQPISSHQQKAAVTTSFDMRELIVGKRRAVNKKTKK